MVSGVGVAPTSSTAKARAPWPLFVLSGSLAAGYGTLFTLVGDYRDNYGIGESMIGLIIGVGFVVSFLAQTLLGPLGDQGRARLMIMAGTAANVVGLVMMAFGETEAVLLAGRVISGLGVGAVGPPLKRIVVVQSRENLGHNLGLLFSADVFGFAMGPVVSAVLVGPFGIAAPFLVIAAANIVSAALVLAQVEEDDSTEIEPSRFAFDLLRHRPFAGAVILGMAAYVMIGTFDALWDVVHSDLNTAAWMANLGIALFAIPLVILGPFAGRLAQQRGPFIIAAAGLAVAAGFMGAYGVMAVGGAIFALTMVHAVTDGLSFAASGVAVGMTAPEHRQAGAQGVLGGMQSLSAGLMAPVAGWAYENHGQQTAYWLGAGTVFAMVVVGLAVAGPAARSTSDTSPDKATP